MRWDAIALCAALLAASGCRHDPLAAALKAPRPLPQPPRVAVAGDAITIAMVLDRVRAVVVVRSDGTIDAPLCGSVLVAGRDAATACAAVAECLSGYYRSAALQLTIGDPAVDPTAREGCHAEGPSHADGWAPASARALEVIAGAAGHDPLLLARSAEAAAELEAVLVRYTELHPSVVAANTRLDRLTTAAAQSPGQPDGAGRLRNRLDTLLVDADREVEQLSPDLGAKHPDLRAARARRDLLADAVASVSATPAPTPEAERRVALLEVETRIEAISAQGQVEGPQLLALQRQRSDLQPTGDSSDVACTELVAAFDLQVARLQGARAATRDDTGTLDLVLDALAVARTDALLGKTCAKLPFAGVRAQSAASAGSPPSSSGPHASPPT